MYQRNLRSIGRMVFISIAIGVITAIIAGCLTPALPVPVTGDDALLLIYVEAPRTLTQHEIFSKIELQIQGRGKPIVLNPMERLAFVQGLIRGNQASESFCAVPFNPGPYTHSAWNREPQPQTLRISFEMKANTITVYPMKFVYLLERSSDGSGYSSGWKLETLDSEDVDKIREYVGKMENSDQWELAFPQQKKGSPQPEPESPALKR